MADKNYQHQEVIVKQEDISQRIQDQQPIEQNDNKEELNLFNNTGTVGPLSVQAIQNNQLQMQPTYSWGDPMKMPMPDTNYFYPGYHNQYMVYYPYSQTDFLGQTYKTVNDNMSMMTRTPELFNRSPFFGKIPSHFSTNPYQQNNYFYEQPQIKHEMWATCKNQDEADKSEYVTPHESEDSMLPPRAQKNSEQKRRLKLKNQTKNIPKNYGKAMIGFILSHLDWIQSQFGIQKRQQLIAELKKRKSSVNAIVHLKDLWSTSKYSKQFRILSSLFLRKYSYAYIFNSRVSNYSTHIKYKYKLQQALKEPINFSRIKQY